MARGGIRPLGVFVCFAFSGKRSRVMWPRQGIVAHGSDDRKVTDPADGCNQRSGLSMSIRQAWFVIPLGVFLFVGLVSASLYYYFRRFKSEVQQGSIDGMAE